MEVTGSPLIEGIDLAVWVPVAIAVVSAIWATWRTRMEKSESALAEHATETDKRLDGVEGRLSRIEEWQVHAPTSESLAKIHRRLDGLSETLHEIKGAHDNVSNLMRIIVNSAFQPATKKK